MPRKPAAAATHATPIGVAPPPPVSDTVTMPPRRARRARVAPPAVAPMPVKVAVDLAQKGAKEALAKAFPRPTSDRMIASDDATARAALEYMTARDAAQIAEGAKERAANVIRYAIGDDMGIEGDGWRATWREERGDLDVSAMIKELAIPQDVVERFRRANRRVLRVIEVPT